MATDINTPPVTNGIIITFVILLSIFRINAEVYVELCGREQIVTVQLLCAGLGIYKPPSIFSAKMSRASRPVDIEHRFFKCHPTPPPPPPPEVNLLPTPIIII